MLLASVCHHPIAWSAISIGPYPRAVPDPTTALCRSCLDFAKLMAHLTHHHSEWVFIMSFKNAHVKVIRDNRNFQNAGEERRHHYRTSHRLRSEYDRSVRYHQDHDNPALPVVNRRGASLIPSLASRDEPAVEPKRRFYRRAISTNGTHGATLVPSLASHAELSCEPETPESIKAAELLREQTLKTVEFAEGPRTYIKPTYMDGVPGHILEVLDHEPHPTRETARHRGASHLQRMKWTYEPGRYADQDGWYWQQIVDFEDSSDSSDSSDADSMALDASLGLFPGFRTANEKFGLGKEREGGSLLDGALPGLGTMKRRDSPQQQQGSAHSEPVCGEKRGRDFGEDSGETEQPDTFFDAQESLASSAHLRSLPQQQEASAFVHFDPIGGEDFPSDGNEDEDEQDEQPMEIDECDTLESARESLSSAHARRYPSGQQPVRAQFDPFGFDEEPEETGESDIPGSDQESLSSARLRFASVPDSNWTMPESEK